ALPRHGVIGPEDEGHGVDQEDLAFVARYELRFLDGRRFGRGGALGGVYGCGLLLGGQRISLAFGGQHSAFSSQQSALALSIWPSQSRIAFEEAIGELPQYLLCRACLTDGMDGNDRTGPSGRNYRRVKPQ
ncbi:MAG: hypothetical protein DMG85_18170, partial [Acidobacteria bacterium]